MLTEQALIRSDFEKLKAKLSTYGLSVKHGSLYAHGITGKVSIFDIKTTHVHRELHYSPRKIYYENVIGWLTRLKMLLAVRNSVIMPEGALEINEEMTGITYAS